MKEEAGQRAAHFTVVIRSAGNAKLAALWKPLLEKACREARRETARGEAAPR